MLEKQRAVSKKNQDCTKKKNFVICYVVKININSCYSAQMLNSQKIYQYNKYIIMPWQFVLVGCVEQKFTICRLSITAE